MDRINIPSNLEAKSATWNVVLLPQQSAQVEKSRLTDVDTLKALWYRGGTCYLSLLRITHHYHHTATSALTRRRYSSETTQTQDALKWAQTEANREGWVHKVSISQFVLLRKTLNVGSTLLETFCKLILSCRNEVVHETMAKSTIKNINDQRWTKSHEMKSPKSACIPLKKSTTKRM